MRVIWSARAITDLLTIRSYIRQNNPDAAQRIAWKFGLPLCRCRDFPTVVLLARMVRES
jgi:hypothetical protein